MEDTEEHGSGDIVTEEKGEEPQPPPPAVPDVVLVADGFGIMPKQRSHRPSQDKNLEEIYVSDEESKSPCSSSSNIDIVRRYTWKTKNRMTVQVITYGATITSIQVPDRKGVPDDVVAGFDTLEEYMQPRNPYFGATIGRCANYIREGTICMKPEGRTYMLSLNKGHHHYNGGHVGFDKVNWRSYVTGNKVIMSHISERMHEGYPGALMVQISFEVTCDNTLHIDMKCTTSEPTIVNLSNAPFFNLCGHHSGCDTMYDHIFTINADKYTPTDDDGVVTGEKNVVGGTYYDFRVPRLLQLVLPKVPQGGYDVNYCVTRGTDQDLTFQARALHAGTGRVLEVYSNQPGLQFYTGNLLPDPDKIVEALPAASEEEHSRSVSEESVSEEASEQGEEASEDGSKGVPAYGYVPLQGKQGTHYKKHGLFCLMPQNFPDAVNNKNFPKAVLNPGEVYSHKIRYKFGLLLGKYT